MEKSRENRPEITVPNCRESCSNPWNGECRSTDILLYVLYKGDRVPICRACWNEIVDLNVEWGANNA